MMGLIGSVTATQRHPISVANLDVRICKASRIRCAGRSGADGAPGGGCEVDRRSAFDPGDVVEVAETPVGAGLLRADHPVGYPGAEDVVPAVHRGHRRPSRVRVGGNSGAASPAETGR